MRSKKRFNAPIFVGFVFIFVCFSFPACTSENSDLDLESPLTLEQAIDYLQTSTQHRWQISTDPERNVANEISGMYETGIPIPNKMTAERRARDFLKKHKDLFRIDVRDLKTKRVNFNRKIGYIKVELQQYYHGIPVQGAITEVFMKESGMMETVQNRYQPDIDLSTVATIKKNDAIRTAFESVTMRSGLDKRPEVSKVIYFDSNQPPLTYHFCWKVVFTEYTFFVDAQTGKIVARWGNIKR